KDFRFNYHSLLRHKRYSLSYDKRTVQMAGRTLGEEKSKDREILRAQVPIQDTLLLLGVPDVVCHALRRRTEQFIVGAKAKASRSAAENAVLDKRRVQPLYCRSQRPKIPRFVLHPVLYGQKER